MSRDSATILSILSGKGGTGKTSYVSVLGDILEGARLRVLLVDLDIYVRGLTTLLHQSKGGLVRLADEDQSVVSDIISPGEGRSTPSQLGIMTYANRLDILPSVRSVNEIVNYNDLVPHDLKDGTNRVKNLIKMIPDRYDYIIFDCRAGYDELIASTAVASNYVICVEEEDNISQITTDNLISQLKGLSIRDDSIFRVTNKARNIESLSDLRKRRKQPSTNITDIGLIPFDKDVLIHFGNEDFFDNIYGSLFRYSVSLSWNTFASKVGIDDEVNLSRNKFLLSHKIEKKLSSQSHLRRLLIVQLLIISTVGLLSTLYGYGIFQSLTKSSWGLVSLLTTILSFNYIVYLFLDN